MKRKRRSAQSGEFVDPLKDYSAPQYEDDLERTLGEETVLALKTKPFLTLDSATTVEQILRVMADEDIACVLVTEDDRLVGIFSERDVLYKVAERFEQIKNDPVKTVMTHNPVAVHETDSPAKAINLMAVGGFRHVPIVDVNDKVVGILGPRRVTAYLNKNIPESSDA